MVDTTYHILQALGLPATATRYAKNDGLPVEEWESLLGSYKDNYAEKAFTDNHAEAVWELQSIGYAIALQAPKKRMHWPKKLSEVFKG